MALSEGTKIGPYEVIGLIGQGGMGEVWQARDTKLDRDVALKVLPEAFTSDPDRLARFEREAKVLASLNHPNIGSIYGLEEADGGRALVLELVEGPTLADRIKQGPIPLDDALPIAKQIAEALEAAHEAGVIHRDLKPANIKVREDGTVKVLDFGLAKALDPNPEGDPSQSPTLTAAATQMGVIMGTAAYMSPEQARGKRIDKRTDIWAFGCVLYEMLTGQRAFQGEDVSLTLASVMRSDPDWDALPADLSPALGTYLRRCLEKAPRQRVRDIGDLRLALEGGFDTMISPMVATAAPSAGRPTLPAIMAATVAAVLAGLAVWGLMRRPDPPVPVLRTPLTMSADAAPVVGGVLPALAISADGTMVAYRGRRSAGTGTQLYLRRLDQLETSPIGGTEDGEGPFFSPDGAWLGFWRRGRLMKVPTVGGRPTEVVRMTGGVRGASWGPDDLIILADAAGRAWRVPAEGGAPQALQTQDVAEGTMGVTRPSILPDGRAVVFSSGAGRSGLGEVVILFLDTGIVTPMGVSGRDPRVVASGHLVFVDADGSVFAAPFDLDQRAVTGSPVPVGVRVSAGPGGAGDLSVFQDGRLVYVPAVDDDGVRDASLVWVGRDRQEETVPVSGRRISRPRLSPTGDRVAMMIGSPPDIWTVDLARGGELRLTDGGGVNMYPAWTPDGASVTFASRSPSRAGTFSIYSRPADGSGAATVVVEATVPVFPGSWSPDGTLLYWVQQQATLRDLWMQPTGGSPAELLATPFNERAPRISPNGLWFAYVSDRSGNPRVFVQPFPGGGEVIPISTGPGTEPVWARDGSELFYRDGPRMMAVSVDSGSTFIAGPPRLLFEGPYLADPGGIIQNYDVSLDGEQFLMVKPAGVTGAGPERTDIIVVENWFEELKRLVPTN